MVERFDEVSRTYRILHLSDPHLTGSGRDGDGVDAAGSLRLMLADVRRLAAVDLVVVSGDVADDGSAAGCAAVLEQVGALAAEWGVPHVYTTGNHDDRTAFTTVLGSGHRSAEGTDLGTPMGDGRCAAVSQVRGLRVITLDSLVPGETPGLVGPEQLDWLRTVLAEPAPDGTVLVLHHPPIHLPDHFTADVGLRDAADLAVVVAGTDVRVILCGHFHLQLSGTLAGVPVWATPGVVTRIDLTSAPHVVRGVLGAGATVVDLGGPYGPMFSLLHARDPAVGRQVYLYDAASGTDLGTED